ncbi:pseudouridylate synthase 1 homolog [Halyomorpha halys]|uniref:pseudouridylate synthase 1 homolog n=1 Tax=Halyomorpha halys TaxID=286706 RepID=UPI0006D4E3BB|nr:tRNA pseudouridine synthase A [Halyomorpha halys]
MRKIFQITCKNFLFPKVFYNTMGECVGAMEESTINPLKRISESCMNAVEEKRPLIETPRVKRRKCAVLICYSGQGYLGLQRNPGMKTIEEDLFVSMLKAGVITDEAFDQPKIIEFQRAARTDKGVSAVKQVLSVKLPMEVCLKTVNSYLPDQIRMVAIKRATKGFNCKGNCDARTYSYMMPTFTLSPQNEPLSEDYRIPPSVIESTNKVLETFLGTHNYHNFTSRKKPLDPSAKRYVISFTSGDPIIIDNMEFITLKVKGQSFMLHQIRKMVGLTIAIVRGLTPLETLTRAYGEERLDIPIAPGVGLVLEEVHYDRYNQRFGNDGIHEPIEWSEVENKLEEFKKKFILPTIVKAEKEDKSMLVWLNSLPLHSFDVRVGDRNQVNKDDPSINNEPKEDCSEDARDIKEKIQTLSGETLNGTTLKV